MSENQIRELLELGRRDDPACATQLAAFNEPELVGEVLTELYRIGTPAARSAVREALAATPFVRGHWQGFKRIYKLAEVALDQEFLLQQIRTLDGARWGPGVASYRTRSYLLRRSYRLLKRLAHTDPPRFRAFVADLLPRYAADATSALLPRLLRIEGGVRLGVRPGRFVVRLENPFRAEAEAGFPEDLLELDSDALTRPLPAPEPPREAPAPLAKVWQGPIFPEVWTQDPAWLVALLQVTQQPQAAQALATLLAGLGERLHEVELERFYALLEHGHPDAWRLALSQLAQRARHTTLRHDAFVGLFARAAGLEGDGAPDWDVLADLLWILEAPEAEAAREQLAPALRALVCRHPQSPGVGPVVEVLARQLPHRLGPPTFDWDQALILLAAERPDVRELGRTVAQALGAEVAPSLEQRAALLTSGLVQDDPDALVELLSAGAMAGAAPPQGWPLDALGPLLDALPAAGFGCLERALWRFEEAQGLDPAVGGALAGRDERRTRALGLALLDAAAARGALDPERLAELAGSGREDVVVWARERIEALAVEGRLPNPVLYRLLDAATRDVRGFGRALVREHLERFEVAELIVFCAESPDAPTAALGIELYRERAQEHAFDLGYLLPLFRILLYKVASARAEKERIYRQLTAWALEAPEHAELAAAVVAAFGRSRVQLDFARALSLLVKIKQRYPAIEAGVEVAEVFGATAEGGSWS